MKLARSVAKKTIASAISSAVPGRPAGAWAASFSRPSPIASVPSVRVGPGLTALTRTPLGPFPGPLRPLREDPDRFVPWAVIKGFFGRFMGRSEREHARVVDQNIDMAVAKFDRPSRHFAGARRVSKVRRKEIGFPSCGPDFGNRLLAALHIATYDHDVDAKLR